MVRSARPRGFPMDALLGASNAAFFAFNAATYAFSSVSWTPPLTSLSTATAPIIFFGWHANAWASPRLFRDVEAGLKPWLVAHDGLISQMNCRAGAPWGLDAFTFARAGATSPRAQIAAFMERTRRNLLLFPDSGGPYRRMKPGIVEIARATKALLVPFSILPRGAVRLARHGGHIIGLPFCSLTGLLGEPIDGEAASVERCQRALEDLEREARREPPQAGG